MKTNRIPRDGLLLQASERVHRARVRVVRAMKPEKEIPISELIGFDSGDAHCRVGGTAFYVGDAPRKQKIQEREALMRYAVDAFCGRAP